MVDQRVEIVAYDIEWPKQFLEQEAKVSAVLAPWLAGPVEHVGSTAVPGLPAKPIIDMLAPVHSLSDAQAAVRPLEEDGWLSWPDDPKRLWRVWFLRPRPAAMTHHLHVIEHDHVQAHAMRRFRDALRSDRVLCAEYVLLKFQLASLYPNDRDAYTRVKGRFIEQVLRVLGVDLATDESLGPQRWADDSQGGHLSSGR